MIQKRMTMVISAHPSISKWWWIGAIRKTRLPVSLKLATWITTDIVIITKRPPRTTRSSSVRVRIARPARAAPRDSDPVSPMMMLAGEAFHHRNPKQAPAMAQATTARSSASRTS